MAGHGGPLPTRVPRSLARWEPSFALALLLASCLLPAFAHAQDELRVRLGWGFGTSRSWQGTIHVTSGAIAEFIPLGLESDAPGSMHLIDESTLAVAPKHPRGYDGVELLVRAPRDAALVVELAPDGGEPAQVVEWPLLTLAKVLQQANLDDQANRLIGQRSPGDRLPVSMDRDTLVFSPGEKLEFTVMPRALDLAANSGYVLNVSLQHARGAGELTSQDREFKTDEDSLPQLEGIFALTLPIEEGVYDVRIALYAKRLGSAFVRGRPICERRVQLVVVDPAWRASRDDAEWQTALELDPAQPRWWEKMIRIPSISRLPGVGQQSYGNGQPGKRVHLDRTLIELSPEMWQAYPLAIGDVGRLHMLEVDYPADLPQSLQVSLIEPNAAGIVAPVGLDTGLEVSEPLPGATAGMRTHRVPFWPQTKSPLVLLVNRSSSDSALFGQIRVQVGPERLPKFKLPPLAGPQRMLAVSLDRPFFCENFGAGEALDPVTGHTRKDWLTFYHGASRLVEYLDHSGRNAALVTLAGEGSGLYPSALLEPTPKFDTGTYFDSGQDPLRKDVAELLFRMFDRAGLQLIPAVRFTTPLPELEALARQRDQATGLFPIGLDGQSWMARQGGHRGAGIHYNPLDPRVQQALRRVVAEIAERYGHHPSFGGVAVHLGPDSYLTLPDETYSLDDATIARFSAETKTVVPGDGTQRYLKRAHYLAREGRSAWLDWRAGKLAELFHGMEADIARTHAGARLLLHTGELLASRTLEQSLRPSLPQPKAAASALLQLGLDPQRLVAQGTIIVPRSQRLIPAIAQPDALPTHFRQLADLDELLGGARASAAIWTHEPAQLWLTSFDENSPFGAEKTHTWFIPPLAPAAAASRQRLVHSLATIDAQIAIDAGWLLPLGHDAPTRGIVAVYRRLPAERFQQVEPRDKNDRTQPVVVRTLSRDGKTYFYAANDSPWPVTLEIEFESPEIFRLLSYHPEKPGTLARQASRGTWSVKLDPFDLVGGELSSARVKINTWRVTLPEEAEAYLRQQIQEARLRAASLRQPQPRQALGNPSFELVQQGGGIFGWTNSLAPGAVIEVDPRQSRNGGASLHLASRQVGEQPAPIAWVRSEYLDVPQTGRLCLVAWLKVADPARQPALRLAMEWKQEGRSRYQRVNVGAAEGGIKTQPLAGEWTAFRFPLDTLPPEGVSELRVGFDLMGEGEVWIDDVEVHDLYFEDVEQRELLKMIANADFQLSSGQVADAWRFVDGYWPRFLRTYVALPVPQEPAPGELFLPPPGNAPASASRGAQARRERRRDAETSPAPEESPGMLERWRNWWNKPTLR